MSNCEQNCESVANLNDYAANLIEYSKRIDKWVNGGQTEFVDVGGVQTPTLRNLAMMIKALMGVHPDNKTIFINQDKEIYVKLSALIQNGGGLNIDSDGKIYVDFTNMPTDKYEAVLRSIRVPIWLSANTDFYVNNSHPNASDTLDDGRGMTPSKPFLTPQAACDFICDNYNLTTFNATVHIANGTYGSLNLKAFSRTNGKIILYGQSQSGVIIKQLNIGSSIEAFTIYALGGVYNLTNMTIDISDETKTGSNFIGYGVCSVNGSVINLQNVNVAIRQTKTVSNTITGIFSSREGSINLNGGINITGNSSISQNNLIAINVLSGELIINANVNVSGNFSDVVICRERGLITRSVTVMPTFTGSATGTRFRVFTGGGIFTYGGGENYFPGSLPGTVDSSTYSVYN